MRHGGAELQFPELNFGDKENLRNLLRDGIIQQQYDMVSNLSSSDMKLTSSGR